MKLAALETLDAVLATGTLAAAAERVGLTPSAVSLQMKQLEEYFGRPLFDRSGRAVRPTPFASELARGVSAALAVVEGFRVRPTYEVAGTLRLGAVPSVQSSVLPVALRLAQERHPDLHVQLTLDLSPALLAAVNAGRIDAAAIVRPTAGGSRRLHWSDLAREPFVLLVPAAAPELAPHQYLARLPWIRYDTALTGGQVAARYVQKLCPGARPKFEIASTEAIIAMVAEGLGVSVIPRPRMQLRKAYEIREVQLGKNGPSRLLSLVRRVSQSENRLADAMELALRDAYLEAAGQH